MIESQNSHRGSVLSERTVGRLAGAIRLRLALAAVLAGVGLFGAGVSLAAPPPNDVCAGAIAIPAGSFPVVTAPVDVTQATPQGFDEGLAGCVWMDYTIWYSFTPTTSGAYVFSTCAGSGATGSTVYDTALAVFDSTSGSCPLGPQRGCNDTDAQCSAQVPGAPYTDQSTVTAALVAGNTYFVVAGHWAGDTGGVQPGLNQIAVKVDFSAAPANDTCSAPTPLALNRVVRGTTVNATNDYLSTATSACFSGVGQALTTAPGRDVVFSFTAPNDGRYSIRYVQDDTAAALRSQNPVLYASSSCPAPAPGGAAVPCLKGANRIASNGAANGNLSEEIDCLPLISGQTIYVYFDDVAAANAGGPMALEVTACNSETEPNGTPATANVYSGCSMTGSAASPGDVDFFDLGAPPAGSKVFAALDTVAANNSDFELRVTTATDTLGYDDNDGTSWIGSNAPVIAGVIANGSQIYVRANSKSVLSEPYHLYTRVESGPPQLEVEAPPNDTIEAANLVTGGGFIRGTMSSQIDSDCFRFVANVGDNIAAFSDNNPDRVSGTITNVWPVLEDLVGGPPADLLFSGQAVRNNLAPSPGTLTGVSPSVTSEFWDYRARYTGTYWACFIPTRDSAGNLTPGAGFYPLPYQGSISVNCGPIPAPSSRVADVSISMSGPTGPVNLGAFADYAITLTNTGSEIAQDVRMVDALPPELVFVGLTTDDGFAGNNVACVSLPSPGTTGATIDCTDFSLAPGASATLTLHVQMANCIGAGATVSNSAAISTASTDPNSFNDSATASFTSTTDGTCTDISCDGTGCVPNLCTTGDHCEGAVCVGSASACADGNPCTDDLCAPATGACVHANNTAPCDDGNACTRIDSCQAGACVGSNPIPCTTTDPCHVSGSCDPSTGLCSYSAKADGSTCSDGNACTTESCQAGVCVSTGAVTCEASDQCHLAGTCDPGTGTCSNPAKPSGTSCNDGNACTAGDTCQPFQSGTSPLSALLQGADGALYGTTYDGGNGGWGTIFRLNPDGSGFTVLKSFDASTTGAISYGALIQGTDGALYGTTHYGGSGGGGTVFKLRTDGTDFTVLTSFGPEGGPYAGLMQGTDGALYGMTFGTSLFAASVYKLNTDGTGFTVLKNFDFSSTGSEPWARLIQGGDGVLYGTTSGGGTFGYGTIFKLNPDGTGFAVLKQMDLIGTGGTPISGLIQGQDGVLYGTANVGGSSGYYGTVFKLNTDGTGFTVLKNLDSSVSGDSPEGALIQGADGRLYGTTVTGGAHGGGTLFSLNTDGTGFTVLASLQLFSDVGGNPIGGLIRGADGALYGTASHGGNTSGTDLYESGTVFKLNTDGSGLTVLEHFSTSSFTACAAGASAVSCDDHNPCTDDSCDPSSGCVHTDNTAPCNDGDACTLGDACSGGACVAGTGAPSCDDHNPCTDDSCSPSIGCVHTNNTAPCNDGNACTQTDTCQAGACTGSNFSWSGFLQPVNSDGSSVFKLGSTIPVKFKLTGACAGNAGLIANIYFYRISNGDGPVNEAVSTSAADSGTMFRYSASDDQYIFNLGTKGLTDGMWMLGVDLHDGTGNRVVSVGLRK